MRDMNLSRRQWLMAAAAAGAGAAAGTSLAAHAQDDPAAPAEPAEPVAPAAPVAAPLLVLGGQLTQGGLLFGRLGAPAPVYIDNIEVLVGDDGAFVTGFDRDAGAQARLEIGEGAGRIGVDLNVAGRTYASGENIATTRGLFGGGGDALSPLDDLFADESELDALIEAEARAAGASRTRSLGAASGPDPDELRDRIYREWRLKQDALSSRAELSGFLSTFVWPIEGDLRITSEWGTDRVYSNGSRKPHYGVDIASPVGTPVRAPAAAEVTLAEPDMYYEGGCVFLDHGLGLTSIYLHMNEVLVEAGQTIAQSAPIGKVGTKGRSTGPHLCWRLYWRDRKLDPSLLTA